jgi:hypothetical protein
MLNDNIWVIIYSSTKGEYIIGIKHDITVNKQAEIKIYATV